MTHGLSLAKFLGAKVTVITVDERLGDWLSFAESGVTEAFAQYYTEQIKKHAVSVLDRVANAAKQAGVPCDTIHVQDVQPYEASLQRPRTGAAILSLWHRTAAADYPQLCSAV